MLRFLSFVALFAAQAEGISFLKRKVTPALGKTYKTAVDACCACFHTKYAWPENAGLSATFAPKKTCNTCYAADRFGIDTRAPAVFESPLVSSASTGSAGLPEGNGQAPYGCQDVCDTYRGCGYKHISLEGVETDKEFHGSQACARWVSDPLMVVEFKKNFGVDDVCSTAAPLAQLCPITCKSFGCAVDAAYEVKQSAVDEVHEWNWNCAEGDAPENSSLWLKGAVNGEPAARAPYTLCAEDAGFQCAAGRGPGLRKAAGSDEVERVDDDSALMNSVATKSLPNIKFEFIEKK